MSEGGVCAGDAVFAEPTLLRGLRNYGALLSSPNEHQNPSQAPLKVCADTRILENPQLGRLLRARGRGCMGLIGANCITVGARGLVRSSNDDPK